MDQEYNPTPEEILREISKNDIEVDDDYFQPCENCDLPDACADFGCAIKQRLRNDENLEG